MNPSGKYKRLETNLRVVFNLIWSNFMSKKVLIVLTSHDTLGDTGKETGFYLPEVSHPVAEFDRAGLTVEYVSPKGGKAPMIGIDLNDPLNVAFLENPEKMAQVKNTLQPSQVGSSGLVVKQRGLLIASLERCIQKPCWIRIS
jgi:putative intracellular protease/amidase